MRYWTIVYPDQNSLGEDYVRWETMSDEEILKYYWIYWFTKMVEAKRPDFEITPERCIEDWCVVHWAQRNYWREMKECIA